MSIQPKICRDGKIIVVELPRIGVTIWKQAFYQTIETARADEFTRGCFLYSEDGINFTTENDALFQAVSHALKVAVIY